MVVARLHANHVLKRHPHGGRLLLRHGRRRDEGAEADLWWLPGPFDHKTEQRTPVGQCPSREWNLNPEARLLDVEQNPARIALQSHR